jgi:hypothetical protein
VIDVCLCLFFFDKNYVQFLDFEYDFSDENDIEIVL